MIYQLAIATLVVYALLLGVGGFIGYRKAGSRASLIAGSASAAGALAATALMVWKPLWGEILGVFLSSNLVSLFGYRYAVKTRKFMPSGMLAVVSVLVFVILIASVIGGGSSAS